MKCQASSCCGKLGFIPMESLGASTEFFWGLPWWLRGKESATLPTQKIGAWSCLGATKPVCHNYLAFALDPGRRNYWAHVPQLLKPTPLRACALQDEQSPQWEAHRLQQRVAPAHGYSRKARTATTTQHSQKKNNFFWKKFFSVVLLEAEQMFSDSCLSLAKH